MNEGGRNRTQSYQRFTAHVLNIKEDAPPTEQSLAIVKIEKL